MTVDLTETQDGQIFITTEDGQGETRIILLLRAPFKLKLLSYPSTGYPVSVSNVISVPVSMYQSVMANMQTIQTNSDGTVCLAPMQVDTTATRGSAASSTSPSSVATAGLAGGVQCYSLISAGTAVLSRRSQQAAPGGRYYLAAATTAGSSSSSSNANSGGFNNNNSTLTNNNNNNNSIKMPLPIVLATPAVPQAVASTRSTRRGGGTAEGAGAGTGLLMVQKRRKLGNASSKSKTHAKASEATGSSSSSSAASIRCVNSDSLINVQLQLPTKSIKQEHLE